VSSNRSSCRADAVEYDRDAVYPSGAGGEMSAGRRDDPTLGPRLAERFRAPFRE
jgi:hypothetical protein